MLTHKYVNIRILLGNDWIPLPIVPQPESSYGKNPPKSPAKQTGVYGVKDTAKHVEFDVPIEKKSREQRLRDLMEPNDRCIYVYIYMYIYIYMCVCMYIFIYIYV
jgi:hypothetical protein